jgi:hypothetical protein
MLRLSWTVFQRDDLNLPLVFRLFGILVVYNCIDLFPVFTINETLEYF